MSEIPDYIKISVAAVGGIDSEMGQEMLRLLTAKTDLPEITVEAEPITAIEAPKSDGLMPPDLEALFSQQFKP